MDVFNFVITDGAVIDAPRYVAALRQLGVPQTELQRLRIQVAGVAGTRRGLLEVRSGTTSLALRPLPAAPSEITLHARPVRDERTQPGRFGPDAGWQQSQLAKVAADEGLLVDASSRVISGLINPIVVVERDRVRVSSHPAAAPSIALCGVCELLRHRGVEITEEARGFDRFTLTGSELWVVDPLYGARLVQSWIEYGTPRPAATLFQRGCVPSHREVNEARKQLAAHV